MSLSWHNVARVSQHRYSRDVTRYDGKNMENESWYKQSSDAAQPEQEGQTEFFLSCVRGEVT